MSVGLLNPKHFQSYNKKFSDGNDFNFGFGWIEMRAGINSNRRFCKANIMHPRSRKDNPGTWTKLSSSRSNQITISDSDHTSHICFLREIVFIKACK